MVHLSDIHFSEAYYMPEIADSMLENINRSAPDIVIVTGDLTENGLAAEYDGAKNFIDRIECKNKVIVPGNHDSRNAGYLFFEDIFKARSTFRHFGEITVVGLDSSQPDLEDGHIGRENYGWIERTFSGSGFKVFALHHHLIPIPRTGRGNNVLVDAGDVLELLDQFRCEPYPLRALAHPLGLEIKRHACHQCGNCLLFQNSWKNFSVL